MFCIKLPATCQCFDLFQLVLAVQDQGSFNLQMVQSEIVSSDLAAHPNLSIALCLLICIRT